MGGMTVGYYLIVVGPNTCIVTGSQMNHSNLFFLSLDTLRASPRRHEHLQGV